VLCAAGRNRSLATIDVIGMLFDVLFDVLGKTLNTSKTPKTPKPLK
jgi:hypothetical protein